jgi:hypothetical protein
MKVAAKISEGHQEDFEQKEALDEDEDYGLFKKSMKPEHISRVRILSKTLECFSLG